MTPDDEPVLGAIQAAAERIRGHVRRTPVLTVDDGLGLAYPVQLKLELLQHTGSFKPRGAFNNLLSRDVPQSGVVAASGGNHGAAVAFAARKLAIPARIFVPKIAGPAKIALIRETGADLVVTEGLYPDALAAAQAYEAQTGAIQVHAYDAPETVAGQGTVALEWEEQGLDADTVLIAVGGGGLIAGALGWLAGRRRVIAVEPENCPTLHRALAEGPDAEVEVSGIAANALGARKIGAICHGLATAQGVTSLLVTDAAIAEAQRRLWRGLRVLAEPGGATALAALTSGAYVPAPGERIAVLVCGGNPAPDPLAS
ncbi:MAG TPA: threonine/serine dehydratase [Thermohalobaculum sp.]|nr:threonine/serine dehydratase [Thermohalobaculum sp.]